MTIWPTRSLISIGGIALCMALAGSAAIADERADFDTLYQQMHEAHNQGNYSAKEKAARRLLQMVDRVNPKKRGYLLGSLGDACLHQSRTDEASRLLSEAITLYENDPQADQAELAEMRGDLAYARSRQGKYDESELLYRQAIAGFSKALGPTHGMTLGYTSNLAVMYSAQGRFDDAAALFQQVLKAGETSLGKNAPELTTALINLGQIYKNQGLYDKAEPLYRRAFGIHLATIGPKHPDTADTLHRLGNLHLIQTRYAEAETVIRRAIALREAVVGPDSAELAYPTSSLALALNGQERYREAHALMNRALSLYAKEPATDPERIALAVTDLGFIELSMELDAQGEQTLRKALAMYEKLPGFQDRKIGHVSMKLAHALMRQDRWAEAEKFVERSQKIAEASGDSMLGLFDLYYTKARILWRTDRRDMALKVLRQALDIAEVQRQHTSGADVDRAALFADCARGFELMIGCQLELGDAAGAAQTIERFRARTLLDEMRMAGADLLDGVPTEQRAATQQREAALQKQLAALSARLQQLPADGADENGKAKPNPQRQELLDAIAATRELLYQHYRDVRSESEVYRGFLTHQTQLPTLNEIQQSLAGAHSEAGKDCLVLSYFVGPAASYVVAIDGVNTKAYPLIVTAEIAERLQVPPGPLYHAAVQWLLMNANQDGVLQQLSRPNTAEAAAKKLAAMWEMLVPAEVRERITGGAIKRLVVLPDGPLALLPFECLIVTLGEAPTARDRQYLLDVGPPIAYGPSASVLMNLLTRPKTEIANSQPSVLSVGDPAYREPAAAPATNLQADNRQARMRSGLRRLPYSGTESRWVSEVFTKNGQPARRLSGSAATEGGLRSQATGKHVLHLACHGLSDEQYGNLFGALALAPGPKPGNPADDGLLTLGEIYSLDLRGCELAILSACMTNYGPQQKGEGVWALSRGFLVAGVRRVVASNWVVDDEAAATLISLFCASAAKSQAAEQQASGGATDYAAALHAAKRQVRKQEKWQSPYYWGTFVLIGPG